MRKQRCAVYTEADPLRSASSLSTYRGKVGVYEPPRYMTVNTCIEQLLEVEAARGQGVYAADTLCCGVARLGCDDQVSSTLSRAAREILPLCRQRVAHG